MIYGSKSYLKPRCVNAAIFYQYFLNCVNALADINVCALSFIYRIYHIMETTSVRPRALTVSINHYQIGTVHSVINVCGLVAEQAHSDTLMA